MAQDALVQASIRRRLIGLVALLIISLAISPLIFDAAGYKERHIENRIPPRPEMPAIVEAAPAQVEPPAEVEKAKPEPAKVLEPVVVKAPPVEIVEAAKKRAPQDVLPSEDMPTLDANGIPAAWSLQLASFRDERNAKSLRADLTQAGYKVYIRRADELVRVYVGPEMQRTRLEKLKVAIKEQYSLDGMIVRFTTE